MASCPRFDPGLSHHSTGRRWQQVGSKLAVTAATREGAGLTRGALAVGSSEQFFGRAAAPRAAERRIIEAAVFRTITSADWREAFRRVRAEGNAVRDRIRAALGERRVGA